VVTTFVDMTLVPEPHDIRASDAEREAVAAAVRDHAAAGRLDADELEDRLGRVYGARLRADLAPIVADLPPLERAAAPPRPAGRIPDLGAFAPLVALAVLLIAIWALTGAGYFWPMWPIGALALTGIKGHHRMGCGHRWTSRTIVR
jgi:Domain of unknown function (DUF1707)